MIEAVRVPPSASMTSQSTVMVTSGRRSRSTTERSERPINLWISVPLELGRRLEMRSGELPGSIEYSAVTHPPSLLRIQPGRRYSIEAAQSTFVCPVLMMTLPAALR